MTLAKTECHCPHCGKLKLKRDGSPHKCVPPLAEPERDNARLREDKNELHRMAWRLARALDLARAHGFNDGKAELADWSYYAQANGALPKPDSSPNIAGQTPRAKPEGCL